METVFPKSNPLPSLWLKDICLGSTAPPPESSDPPFDVVIIGGGLSGFSTAFHLRKENKFSSIAVVDSRDVSGGATGRNGGLLWPGLSGSFSYLVQKYGLQSVIEVLKFEYENLAAIEKFLSTIISLSPSTLDPHLKSFTGVVAFESESQVQDAEAELKEMKKAFPDMVFTYLLLQW